MNIQELQTIKHNDLKVKVFVLNSNGYLAISVMQEHLFKGAYFGSNSSSGVSSPNFVKVAQAFGIQARVLEDDVAPKSDSLTAKLSNILNDKEASLYEITLPKSQSMKPRVRSKKTEDGKISSGSIDVMWPFLDETKNAQISKEINSL